MTITALAAMVIETARNIYGATGGHVPWTGMYSFGSVAWQWMSRDARAHHPDMHPWDAMALELGITREEFDAYRWARGHDYTNDWQDMTEYQRWRDEHDPMQQLTDLIMEKYRP